MIETITVALATYGTCILMTEYDGPFDIFSNVRSKFKVFRCLACLSVWICAPLAFITGLDIIEYLAAIGIVLAIDRLAA